jgi:hypothetical protein
MWEVAHFNKNNFTLTFKADFIGRLKSFWESNIQTKSIPPMDLISRGSRSAKFFDQYTPKSIPNSKGKLRAPSSKPLNKKLKGCEDKKFLAFV